MITLYDFELSAECYALRLMLAMTGLEYEIRPVDIFPGREQDLSWFRALSPEGTLPVLIDDERVLTEVPAALLHLVLRAGVTAQWAPEAARAEIDQWFEFAKRFGDAALGARWTVTTGEGESLAQQQQAAHQMLRDLDRHLWFGEKEGADWLVAGGSPSLAELALFPAVALCEEGGISRQDYPAVRRWLDRVRRLPGFVVMSGVFPAGRARD